MRAYVIILNWNGWKDTIECLESVLRLDYPHLQILVCDNASSDDSIEKIKSWARGELIAGCPNPQLSHLTSPPVDKPLSLLHLSRHEAESEGVHRDAQIVLIQTGANLGFAGGNNVGMRYALQDQECKYLWLLNNDTIVTNTALSALIQKANENDRTGAVSSICYFADAPSVVESWAGAHVNLWIGYARNSIEPRHDRWFDALYGASMLIARPAIEDCGLLDEGFFLYWDETEFCVRLRKKGWRLAAAPASQVFHKVNASTGGGQTHHRPLLHSVRIAHS